MFFIRDCCELSKFARTQYLNPAKARVTNIDFIDWQHLPNLEN